MLDNRIYLCLNNNINITKEVNIAIFILVLFLGFVLGFMSATYVFAKTC